MRPGSAPSPPPTAVLDDGEDWVRGVQGQCSYGAEERHKSPSKLGRAGEERQKVPLGVALGVCSIGSESLTLPVTLVKVPWKGAFSLAEAERAELELLGLHSWSLNAFRVFRQITPQSPTQHIMRN